MRAFVVGGGPSLHDFDQYRFHRGVVIACHRHALTLQRAPQFQLSPDWVYWRDNRPRPGSPGSVGVWIDLGDSPSGFHPRGVLRLPATPGGLWAHRWADQARDGVMVGGCSGVAALHFACLLGAESVDLVGIDDPGEKEAAAFDFATRCAARAGVRVVSHGRYQP